MLRVKRASERASKNDGARFLVERLWPRGVKKENLRVQDWLKEVAPTRAGFSPELFLAKLGRHAVRQTGTAAARIED